MIPPSSPILNHEDAEENSHEMVIIQSDKSTGDSHALKTADLSLNLSFQPRLKLQMVNQFPNWIMTTVKRLFKQKWKFVIRN